MKQKAVAKAARSGGQMYAVQIPRKLCAQLEQDLTYSWHPLPFGLYDF